jgi:hypothetical protein
VGNLREVSPPKTIQALAPHFNQYQPQVKILSPAPDSIVKKTTVAVQLQAEDFPFNPDGSVPLRPHLHLILDNEPYRAIYSIDKPVILEDLEPGTHTLRVFPVRPWHESYKNDGAYAQVTFHILTKTDSNNPDEDLPLLTYSRPKGDYGAEPILLDYYLSNAPLHIAAQTEADINDWRIRVTVNNESFLLDQWQSVYLAGFETGENWVKLEFIDEDGNLVANRFNNTVRVINYQPDGQDAFSRLMRGDLSLAEAYTLVGLDVPFGLPPEEPLVEKEIQPLPESENTEEPTEIMEEIDELMEDTVAVPTSESVPDLPLTNSEESVQGEAEATNPDTLSESKEVMESEPTEVLEEIVEEIEPPMEVIEEPTVEQPIKINSEISSEEAAPKLLLDNGSETEAAIANSQNSDES